MRLRRNSSYLTLFVPICFAATSALAQPRTPQLPTPPPMRFVAREDRSQLTSAKDAKARIRLTIELADGRLSKIEALTSQRQYEDASEAVGTYVGLIEDAARFVGSLAQDKNSTRDLYRRIDIALRGHIPRLAVARRDTPADYSVHIKAAEEFARNTRSDVLENFYGQTVLRDRTSSEKKVDAIKNTSQENKP
ncbi:MAG: hypothetical protein ACXW18_12390 [Pyrinomonadaceae bacterium]